MLAILLALPFSANAKGLFAELTVNSHEYSYENFKYGRINRSEAGLGGALGYQFQESQGGELFTGLKFEIDITADTNITQFIGFFGLGNEWGAQASVGLGTTRTKLAGDNYDGFGVTFSIGGFARVSEKRELIATLAYHSGSVSSDDVEGSFLGRDYSFDGQSLSLGMRFLLD